MHGGGQQQHDACEVRSDDGSLHVASRAPSVVLVEMRGAIALPHVTGMTRYVDDAIARNAGKVSLFQDLTRVDTFAMEAQIYVCSWALAQAAHVDRLHFALNAGSPLIATIRSVVIALPIRAYMYRDRAGLDAAVQRALPQAS